MAAAIGIDLRLDPVSLAGVAAMIVLGSALFATFSLLIACLVRSRERFMGFGQLLTMPLFFASSAVYPIAVMPGSRAMTSFELKLSLTRPGPRCALNCSPS